MGNITIKRKGGGMSDFLEQVLPDAEPFVEIKEPPNPDEILLNNFSSSVAIGRSFQDDDILQMATEALSAGDEEALKKFKASFYMADIFNVTPSQIWRNYSSFERELLGVNYKKNFFETFTDYFEMGRLAMQRGYEAFKYMSGGSQANFETAKKINNQINNKYKYYLYNPPKGLVTRLFTGLAEFGGQMSSYLLDNTEILAGVAAGSAAATAASGGTAAPAALAATGATAIGTRVANIYTSTAGNMYWDMIHTTVDGKPIDDNIARIVSYTAGAAVSAIEFIQVGKLIKKTPIPKMAKPTVLKFLTKQGTAKAAATAVATKPTLLKIAADASVDYVKTLSEEVIEEVAQEVTQHVATKIAASLSDGKNLEQYGYKPGASELQPLGDAIKQTIQQSVESFALPVLFSIGSGTVGKIKSANKNKVRIFTTENTAKEDVDIAAWLASKGLDEAFAVSAATTLKAIAQANNIDVAQIITLGDDVKLENLGETAVEASRIMLSLPNITDKQVFAHELGHIARLLLSDKQKQQSLKAMGLTEWTREAEEQFADSFVSYLASGRVDNPIFNSFARAFANALGEEDLKELAEINPETKKFFDKMVLINAKPQDVVEFAMAGKNNPRLVPDKKLTELAKTEAWAKEEIERRKTYRNTVETTEALLTGLEVETTDTIDEFISKIKQKRNDNFSETVAYDIFTSSKILGEEDIVQKYIDIWGLDKIKGDLAEAIRGGNLDVLANMDISTEYKDVLDVVDNASNEELVRAHAIMYGMDRTLDILDGEINIDEVEVTNGGDISLENPQIVKDVDIKQIKDKFKKLNRWYNAVISLYRRPGYYKKLLSKVGSEEFKKIGKALGYNVTEIKNKIQSEYKGRLAKDISAFDNFEEKYNEYLDAKANYNSVKDLLAKQVKLEAEIKKTKKLLQSPPPGTTSAIAQRMVSYLGALLDTNEYTLKLRKTQLKMINRFVEKSPELASLFPIQEILNMTEIKTLSDLRQAKQLRKSIIKAGGYIKSARRQSFLAEVARDTAVLLKKLKVSEKLEGVDLTYKEAVQMLNAYNHKDVAIGDVFNGKPVTAEVIETLKNVIEKPLKQSSTIAQFFYSNMRPERFTRLVFGDEGKKIFIDPVREKRQKISADNIKAVEFVTSVLEKIGLNYFELAKDVEFKGHKIPKDLLWAMYAWSFNENAATALTVFGVKTEDGILTPTQEDLKELANILSDEEKSAIKEIMGYYPNFFYDMLDAADNLFDAKTVGSLYSVVEEDNYTPMPRAMTGLDDFDVVIATDAELIKRTVSTPKNKNLENRRKVVNGDPTLYALTGGFITNFLHITSRGNAWKHNAAIVDKLSFLLKDRDLTGAISKEYSQEHYDYLIEYVRQVKTPFAIKKKTAKLSMALSRWLMPFYLGFKMSTMILQTVSYLLGAVPNVNIIDMFTGLTDTIVNWGNVRDRIATLSPALIVRSMDMGLEHVTPMELAKMSMPEQVRRLSMVGIRAFDTVTVTALWNTTYLKYKKQGFTDVEAAQKAYDIIEQTQPEAHGAELPPIYYQTNALDFFKTFSNQINQVYNMMVDIGIDIKEGEWAHAFSLAAAILIQSVLVAMLRHRRPPEDEKELLKWISSTTLSYSIPFAGTLFASINDGFEGSPPAVAFAGDLYKYLVYTLGDDIEAIKDGTFSITENKGFLKALSGVAGLPYYGIRNIINAAEDPENALQHIILGGTGW